MARSRWLRGLVYDGVMAVHRWSGRVLAVLDVRDDAQSIAGARDDAAAADAEGPNEDTPALLMDEDSGPPADWRARVQGQPPADWLRRVAALQDQARRRTQTAPRAAGEPQPGSESREELGERAARDAERVVTSPTESIDALSAWPTAAERASAAKIEWPVSASRADQQSDDWRHGSAGHEQGHTPRTNLTPQTDRMAWTDQTPRRDQTASTDQTTWTNRAAQTAGTTADSAEAAEAAGHHPPRVQPPPRDLWRGLRRRVRITPASPPGEAAARDAHHARARQDSAIAFDAVEHDVERARALRLRSSPTARDQTRSGESPAWTVAARTQAARRSPDAVSPSPPLTPASADALSDDASRPLERARVAEMPAEAFESPAVVRPLRREARGPAWLARPSHAPRAAQARDTRAAAPQQTFASPAHAATTEAIDPARWPAPAIAQPPIARHHVSTHGDEHHAELAATTPRDDDAWPSLLEPVPVSESNPMMAARMAARQARLDCEQEGT